ncbi:hypothetical protein PTI98_005361 [Pleurotus ostreatus]|nr:hypothetical protein PTI98_005361 [Pleurotus ostreatus]
MRTGAATDAALFPPTHDCSSSRSNLISSLVVGYFKSHASCLACLSMSSTSVAAAASQKEGRLSGGAWEICWEMANIIAGLPFLAWKTYVL